MFDSNRMNDSALARLLQEEYDREAAAALEEDAVTVTDVTHSQNSGSTSAKKYKYSQNDSQSCNVAGTSLTPGLSPVDPSLELTDPNPDIRLMFLQFNAQFFWSSLAGIEVKWSPRMTLCAGLCVYEGRGGLCSVRLSLPLLKLRPRKDLVETLLHEMIHAYLFVTNNDSDHSDHGPNFLSHMNRINKATGAGISVYHTFHDEVESYLQHWWRCNGPCQKRAPYYGYVKRSMNRAPSARDLWWTDHQASCGGVYTKIKEPEGYGQKKTGKGKVKEGKPVDPPTDIQTFWGKGRMLGSSSNSVKKCDDTSLTKGRTSTHGVAGSSSSDLSNRLTSKSSDVKQNFTSTHDSLFSVTKSTTSHSTHSSANGYNDTTFQQRRSDSITNKQPTNSSSGTNTKVSDINKKLTDDSLLNQVSWNSSDHDDVIDLTLSDINSVHPKTKVMEKHKGNIFNKSIVGNRLPTKHNKTWKKTPHINNKKVIFPKNFVSVCEGGDFPDPLFSNKTWKKNKYILDELDSNDGLWDESEDSNVHGSLKESSGNNKKEKTTAVISANHWDTEAEKISKSIVGDTSTVMNYSEASTLRDPDRQKKEWNYPNESKIDKVVNSSNLYVNSVDKSRGSHTTFNVAAGHISSNSQSAVAEGKTGRFTGEGQMLGTRESGTSFLSQIRKKWLERSSDAAEPNSNKSLQHSSYDKHMRTSQINTALMRSSLSTRKRTSDEAFDEQDSDMDVQSSKVEKSSKLAARNVLDNEISNVLQGSGGEMSNTANGTTIPDDMVPCPSCTVMVSMAGINAHLDLCLISG